MIPKTRTLIMLVILFVVLFFSAPLLKPKIAIFFNNKGIEYYDGNDFNKAVSFYKKSLWIRQDAQIYCNLANAYNKIGMTQESIREYIKAIKLKPDFTQPYYELADAYRQLEQYNDAFFYLERACALGFSEAKIRLNLLRFEYAIFLTNKAFDFYMRGNKVQAKLKLKEAIELNPKLLLAHKMLGDIFVKENELNEAITYYNNCIDLGSRDAQIYNDVGICYMELGQYSQAVPYLRQAYQMQPSNAAILYNLASTLRDNKNFKEALELYQDLLRINNEYPNVHNDITQLYDNLGDAAMATKEYNNEIQIELALLSKAPNDSSVLIRLAKAHNGLGNYKQAKEFIERALEQNPENGDALYVRAQIYNKLGEFSKAEADLRKARGFFHSKYFINKHIAELENRKAAVATIEKPKEMPQEIEQITYDITIHLKNGSIMRGKLIRQTEDVVYFEQQFGVATGTVGIPRQDIESIEAMQQ